MSIIDFWILLLLCIKKASDTDGIWRSIGGTWSVRPVIGYIFVQQHEELSDLLRPKTQEDHISPCNIARSWLRSAQRSWQQKSITYCWRRIQIRITQDKISHN